MKRALILSVFMLCLAVTGAFAIGDLPTTTNGSWIQGPAPNGLLSQFLTVNSTTIDMSNNTWWSIMAPAAGCKYRILPTTAKGSYPAFTAPATVCGDWLGQRIARQSERKKPLISEG